MNIIIDGGTGFVGGHLVGRLLDEGHNVFCTLIKDELVPTEVNSVYIEEMTIDDITDYFKANKIDGIIHLATLYMESHTPDQVEELIDTNVKFGSLLLEAAIKAKVKWFINTGTFWQNYQNADYSPVNLYAATKQAFQAIAQYYIETNSIKFVTLKLFDTYGPNDTREKVINLWNKISRSGEEMDMTNGEQIIDISYIEDIVDAFMLLVNELTHDSNNSPVKSGSEFAVNAGKRYSLKELAKIFEQVTGKALKINWGAKPYRKREVMIPWEKGTIVPGWKPKTSFEEGIKRTLGYGKTTN